MGGAWKGPASSSGSRQAVLPSPLSDNHRYETDMIYVFSFLRNCQWITKKLDKVTLLPALHDYPFLSEPWLYQTFKLFCQFIVGKWYCIDISTCILQVMNEAEHLNLYWSFVSYLLTFYFPILLPFFPTETIIIFMGWDFLHTKNINPFSLK